MPTTEHYREALRLLGGDPADLDDDRLLHALITAAGAEAARHHDEALTDALAFHVLDTIQNSDTENQADVLDAYLNALADGAYTLAGRDQTPDAVMRLTTIYDLVKVIRIKIIPGLKDTESNTLKT